MMKSGMKRSRSVATRMSNLKMSCTLLVIISIIVLSSCVGAAKVPRQLRGKRATLESEVAYNEKVSRTRRTKGEGDRKPRSTEPISPPQTTYTSSTRIVGGANVEEESRYPWFTRVVGGSDTGGGLDACGGALIAKDLVLTAAHCSDPIKAYPGRHNLDIPANERLNIADFERHPDYGAEGSYSVDFDIMLIHLAEPSALAPVRLNFNDEYPVEADESLTMIGFGSTTGGKGSPVTPSRVLQTAETLYVPFETCAVSMDPDTGVMYGISESETAVSDHWFCTTGPDTDSEFATSTCYGDSGGPILKEDYFEDSAGGATNDLLLAVISGTSGFCGNKHLPLWNSRVSWHKQWIVETGCSLSNDPPAEWNCDGPGLNGLGAAPVDNMVYFEAADPTDAPVAPPTDAPVAPPTDAPVVPPTDEPVAPPTDAPVVPPTDEPVAPPTDAPVAPTDAPVAPTDEPVAPPTDAPVVAATEEPVAPPTDAPVASPTDSPVAPLEVDELGEDTGSEEEEEEITEEPSPAPTVAPTGSPSTSSPTGTPTPLPTTKPPIPFLTPILNPDATEEPTRNPSSSEEGSKKEEDEDYFVCPVCDEDEIITNPEAVVNVPILGVKTCQELYDDAAEGRIFEGSTCDSVLLLANAVCSCAVATESPSAAPSKSPTTSPSASPSAQPSGAPIGTPSMTPSASPSAAPSPSPSGSPTPQPSPSPTKTPGTCEAIQTALEARDAAMMVNVTLSFAFADTDAANSVGWFLSDPDYECFRVGSSAGRYSRLEVTEDLRLVAGVEYLFVVEVDGKQIAGSYNMVSNNSTLAHNLIPGIVYDDEGTLFKTPRN